MPALTPSSPYKQRQQQIIRHRSAEPFPPQPPPKAIDLNSSTKSTDRETGAKVTRRAFLCDVVVEREGEETANLLAHLGQPLKPLSTLPAPTPSTNGRPTTPSRLALPPDEEDAVEVEGGTPGWTGARRQEMSMRLANLIEELVKTERSYLSRIHALKTSYADRLRLFARDPNQQLIPSYEAKNMFANIEAIVPASAAFLTDLDAMMQSGHGEDAVGDICLRHFKDLRTFDPYRTYLSKQDESQKLFQDSLKKFPGFASFIDSTKYQTTGIGNIGLRELLMEPVQRIPRYTLLWQTMIKCMSPLSTQRAKLLEATAIASRIARCEPDPQTVRATVMYHLERSIEDFPAKLFNSNRDYIDSIDVEDLPAEYPTTSPPPSRPLSTVGSRPMSMASSSTPSMNSFGSMTSSSHLAQSPPSNHTALPTLHCTLFLFDDKLMIVKRQTSSISGRKVTGTDDVQKLVKTGGGIAAMDRNAAKKDKLSFRGEVDVLDVIASDVGNGDFHLFLERPPMDQSGRWSARPFRSYSTVHPPYGMSMDLTATRRDKLRFVQNLWAAQALARTKLGPGAIRPPPRVLAGDDEISLAEAGEPFGRAKCFYDVWDRSGWTTQKKAKVVIHIDEDGDAPDLPMQEGGPVLMIRLQPVAGGLCRMSYTTTGDDDDDRMVFDMAEVSAKIATTIHRYGIFKFRTGTTSCPTTPSATSHRLRPSMLNLDAISRNLFGASSVSGRSATSSDMFSTGSSKRASKPPMSRSSTMETTPMSIESGETGTDKKHSEPPSPNSSEGLIAGAPYVPVDSRMGQSEIDLNERLNMARKNSKSVAALSPPVPSRLGARSVAELRGRVEEKQAMERTEDSLHSTMQTTPMSPTAPLRVRNKTPSPTRALSPPIDHTPRPLATPISPGTAPLQVRRGSTLTQSILPDDATFFMSPRSVASPPSSTAPLSPKPTGPRSPPPGPRQLPQPPLAAINGLGLGSAHTKLRIVSGGGRKISLTRETIPLKGDDEHDSSATATPSAHVTAKRQHSSDQLSPRKRSPTRSPLHPREVSDPAQIMPDPLKVPSMSKKPGNRRTSGRHTPRKSSGPLTTPRTVSGSQASVNSVATGSTIDDVDMAEHIDLKTAVVSARTKIHEARESTKRLKTEIAQLRKQMTKGTKGNDLAGRLDRNPSLPRSPQKRNMNRLMDSDLMFDSISSRAPSGKNEIDAIVMDECARGIASIVQRLEGHLRQAEWDNDQAIILSKRMAAEEDEKSQERRSLRGQVQRAKEQRELLQRQLEDATIELDVIYEAFNTELDGMFNDAQLPETEAFNALKADLQVTKAKRNALELENKKLKRQLEEANLKREQWARMLRAQGYEV